tara:strand:+ start:856 stop:1101 length:246 start_codon:yes stop_codon:yes gene_type:complete
MEPKVTFIQLIISSGGAVLAVLGSWIHMKISVASLNTEVRYIKKELDAEKLENRITSKELGDKIDKIFSLMSEIKVSIASK